MFSFCEIMNGCIVYQLQTMKKRLLYTHIQGITIIKPRGNEGMNDSFEIKISEGG